MQLEDWFFRSSYHTGSGVEYNSVWREMILIFAFQRCCVLPKLTKGMNKGKGWGERDIKLWMLGIYRISVHSTIILFFSFSFFGNHLCKEDEHLNTLFFRLITVLFGEDTEVIILLLYSLVYYIHGKTFLFRTSFWFNRKMVLVTAMWNTHFSPRVDFWHINARSLCSLSLSRKTCLRLISSSSFPFKVAVFQCHLKAELW